MSTRRGATRSDGTDVLRAPPWHNLQLLLEFTRKEIRLRYQGSYLGYLWSILNPLALALVFVVAFQVIMRFQIENYALVLIAGLFSWQWFANAVQGSADVYFGSRYLVKKVVFPLEFLPLSAILNGALHFLASIPVVLVLVLWYGKLPTLAWLYGIPILMLTQCGLVYGLALIVSSGNVFFRDLGNLSGVFVLMLFYLTPVIYPADLIPADYRVLFALNPMYFLVTGFRALFIDGVLRWDCVLGSGVGALASLALGAWFHARVRWRLVEAL